MRQGMIYNIQRMSVHDGPGLRTTVFLKGCPLRCLWCSNPESQSAVPQMLFFENLCTGCGKCVEVCPEGAARIVDGKVIRSIAKCTHCGLCTASCPSKAREMSGRLMTVEEVMDVVLKDMLFYENSGGGVTFGGGEPTSGGEFFLDLVKAAHEEGIHVTVDTCGFCPEERFDRTLALADLFLFDCKHTDPEAHRRLTGQDNTLILRNLRAALASGKEVHVRMPLIPGMNDDDANLSALAALLGEFGRDKVEVMPCHAFGWNKYVALGLPAPDMPQYTPEQLSAVLDRFAKHGLVPVMV
ncbi:glycyl-radical enzyme activating protein [Nitratidesulfovibrio vulgaris]|uniref:Pyruvate formate-lyase activating enzyme, putative n=1 Tax=Nitratidesulfovibrio vulgaris (strain ATCC 29579 / DSM 644 / CCUG 34227 / NCIMB 8303 / VKM B-1760 / Hildenborough) TaxID=882 RepID=Q729S8_NITV2|nr:glycyl-radical enzyme activating protein [Nitratidesulfovibrio vulgaris]AAS96744.1 pyruvate formate-lyase activating enzyme, putative [Nitratidesulfovibrio vulgaris str. Hildenborough]ADP87253.1 glycyl-radical enzyme activating protein family [Nitratidesulfovibrio vulgaris RCH1]